MSDSAPVASRISSAGRRPLEEVVALMKRLRHPQHGCPWDLEQTFSSLVRHTLEEAYEVAEAVERNDMASLRDELGDLLLQVVFYSRLAEEDGVFDLDDVAEGCAAKLRRRHPHLFGNAPPVADAAAQTAAWERIKAQERGERLQGSGILDGVTTALPALARARKLQERAARVGFDWPKAADVFDKIEEELSEAKTEVMAENPSPEGMEDEIGDLLFSVVNLARKTSIDPETALRRANRKFERRFRRVESLLHDQGRGLEEATLDEMEALWLVAKREDHDGVPG